MLSNEDIGKSAWEFIQKMEASDIPDNILIGKLYQAFQLLVHHISHETEVLFTSTFARLSYVITTYQIPYKESYALHAFRKWKTDDPASKTNQHFLPLAKVATRILLYRCLGVGIDDSIDTSFLTPASISRGEIRFERIIRVQLQSIDVTKKIVFAQLSDEPFAQISISYGVTDRNEDYTEQMKWLSQIDILPIIAHLIDVEITSEQVYEPSSIVLEPDMLYDVTAVSECFGPFASHEMGFLLRKFSPIASSPSIIVGNLANHFLDQLVHDRKRTWESFIKDLFENDPLGIALLSDREVRDMIPVLKQHAKTIKEVVQAKFEKVGISQDNYLIEPSFFSAKYGIQGRLDLYAEERDTSIIIELKSGKTFRPNNYGLNNNHYHQTLLYDMLIESVKGVKQKRNSFILYSKEAQEPLRYAPVIKAEQREAVKLRNQLYLHDRSLQHQKSPISYILQYIESHADHIKGYQRKDAEEFQKSYGELHPTERAYCDALIKFTMNELIYAKLGAGESDKNRGLASLWRESLQSKIEQYNIINHLELISNQSTEDDPHLIFRKSEFTSPLSNFREGDMAVIYPYIGKTESALYSQVFKVTLLEINNEQVHLRLRSRQDNPAIFKNHPYWNIEHDSLENGYLQMTRNVYEYSKADPHYRQLILGINSPNHTTQKLSPPCSSRLTKEQQNIFTEAIKAQDYYLLWGPPGTGKTSVLLRELACYYSQQTNKRILYLAYTNRAVDEICEALSSIEPSPEFTRIGSRYSTGEKFRKTLLNEFISGITTRHELRERLESRKIYVGTVASILGKDSLFRLLEFDVAIIDEASQILETSLVGLLSRFKKWILIGDHKQLPAVVQQPSSMSRVSDESLQNIGIVDLRNSLFERLYKNALSKKWDHAIGQLTQQGRMHDDILHFPSKHFYHNSLRSISSISRLSEENNGTGPLSHRMIFIHCDRDEDNTNIKINRHEADIATTCVRHLLEDIETRGKVIKSDSIGIITPYRAQIACISEYLTQVEASSPETISIDTVERYQGGARDYIILSACMNYTFQMKSLVSLSDEGIDRKLNVALTRAREKIIIIGNENILGQNETYRLWIEQATRVDIKSLQ